MDKPNFTKGEYEAHLQSRRLMGSRCQECGMLYLPPRPLCSHCFSEAMAWVEVGETGVLTAFTAIHIAPTEMIKAGFGRDNPYVTGIVRLDSGPSISAQIVGVDANRPQSIQIGTPVVARFVERDNGDGPHSFLVFEATDQPVGN